LCGRVLWHFRAFRPGPQSGSRWHNRMPVEQISPDKNVNSHDATAAFTVSPESRALPCGADLPGDSALYAVSVRRLMALHSGFLQTVPRGSALAFGWCLDSFIWFMNGVGSFRLKGAGELLRIAEVAGWNGVLKFIEDLVRHYRDGECPF
jgi:hypothetical protein